MSIWDPTGNRLIVCLFRHAFELPCPGCGLTRAAAFLVRGDVASAVALHPLAPVLALEATAAWLLWGAVDFRRIGGWRFSPTFLEGWGLANAGLLLAVWLGRLAIGDLAL